MSYAPIVCSFYIGIRAEFSILDLNTLELSELLTIKVYNTSFLSVTYINQEIENER